MIVDKLKPNHAFMILRILLMVSVVSSLCELVLLLATAMKINPLFGYVPLVNMIVLPIVGILAHKYKFKVFYIILCGSIFVSNILWVIPLFHPMTISSFNVSVSSLLISIPFIFIDFYFIDYTIYILKGSANLGFQGTAGIAAPETAVKHRK